MKIGYPCINSSINCKSGRTFRLKSYSEERMIAAIRNNLDCLFSMLSYNVRNGILFFRITSQLVPFASHPVCKFPWQKMFETDFTRIGRLIRDNNIRISLHPDQFIIINSLEERILQNSLRELRYHAEVLEMMGLDLTAKIQLHVGGVYGDKEKSKERFCRRYEDLDAMVKRRLVIENDEKSYRVEDCLDLNRQTGVPVLFDWFHHAVNPGSLAPEQALRRAADTWKQHDGPAMMDYSSQQPGRPRGAHSDTIELKDFQKFLQAAGSRDFDVMLEIKDKEKSAIKALAFLRSDPRLIRH